MKSYMILAAYGNRDVCTAFFDSWANAQEYIESLNRCVDIYIEVYERKPYGSGKDYTWEYVRINKNMYGGKGNESK